MLFNGQRRLTDLDLLHDLGEVAIAMQSAATARAGIEKMFLEMGDLLGRKRLAFVFGMTGLAANLAGLASVGIRRALWFDDVRGGWLRGGGGILQRGGELLTQLEHLGPQGPNVSGLSFNKPLQTLALWTRLPCVLAHTAA